MLRLRSARELPHAAVVLAMPRQSIRAARTFVLQPPTATRPSLVAASSRSQSKSSLWEQSLLRFTMAVGAGDALAALVARRRHARSSSNTSLAGPDDELLLQQASAACIEVHRTFQPFAWDCAKAMPSSFLHPRHDDSATGSSNLDNDDDDNAPLRDRMDAARVIAVYCVDRITRAVRRQDFESRRAATLRGVYVAALQASMRPTVCDRSHVLLLSSSERVDRGERPGRCARDERCGAICRERTIALAKPPRRRRRSCSIRPSRANCRGVERSETAHADRGRLRFLRYVPAARCAARHRRRRAAVPRVVASAVTNDSVAAAPRGNGRVGDVDVPLPDRRHQQRRGAATAAAPARHGAALRGGAARRSGLCARAYAFLDSVATQSSSTILARPADVVRSLSLFCRDERELPRPESYPYVLQQLNSSRQERERVVASLVEQRFLASTFGASDSGDDNAVNVTPPLTTLRRGAWVGALRFAWRNSDSLRERAAADDEAASSSAPVVVARRAEALRCLLACLAAAARHHPPFSRTRPRTRTHVRPRRRSSRSGPRGGMRTFP